MKLSNAQPFINLIADHAPPSLNKEWVLWVLQTIKESDLIGGSLNPEWVARSVNVTGQSTIHHANTTTENSEPDWSVK